MRKVYIIGSLRNEKVREVGNLIRASGHDVFDDWHAAGPEADDYWQSYEVGRGHTFREALRGRAAQQVFGFDREWLTWADTVVLLLPAGKSGHLEFGWAVGKGKEGYILMDGEPERFDVMYNFATDVFTDKEELVARLNDGATGSAAGGVRAAAGRVRAPKA